MRPPLGQPGTRTHRSVATWGAAGAFAVWFWATAVSNNPTPGFERLRRLDPHSIILSDWRFFAPTPAMHDAHLIYRTQDAAGTVSAWRLVFEPPRRTWWNTVLYPGRRRGKALHDLLTQILHGDATHTLDAIERMAPFRILRAFAEHEIRAQHRTGHLPPAYQLAIVKHTGYDDDGRTEYLLATRLFPIGRATVGGHPDEHPE